MGTVTTFDYTAPVVIPADHYSTLTAYNDSSDWRGPFILSMAHVRDRVVRKDQAFMDRFDYVIYPLVYITDMIIADPLHCGTI